MTAIVNLYNRIFERIEEAFGPWLLPTLARLAFASVLLFYFWGSAVTKLGEGTLDGIFMPSDGAYVQIFPKAFEAAGYDVTQMTTWNYLVVLLGTWAEFILPFLIVVGLFTRLAALGMIGFIIVQTVVDFTGHGLTWAANSAGLFFDRLSDGAVADQRFLWVVVLLILVIRGAGPISIDAFRPAAYRSAGIRIPAIK